MGKFQVYYKHKNMLNLKMYSCITWVNPYVQVYQPTDNLCCVRNSASCDWGVHVKKGKWTAITKHLMATPQKNFPETSYNHPWINTLMGAAAMQGSANPAGTNLGFWTSNPWMLLKTLDCTTATPKQNLCFWLHGYPDFMCLQIIDAKKKKKDVGLQTWSPRK